MQRKMYRIVATVMAMGIMSTVAITASAEDKKAPTSKEIMKALNDGKTTKGLCTQTATLGKEMKWEEAAKVAKELKEMGDALSKAEPKKGDPESWKKLTKIYAERTTAISEAVDKKDPKALEAAVKAFKDGKTCMECHKAHK